MRARHLLDLSSVRLGRRLTLCFVFIILVMSSGSALLIWQFHLVRVQLDRLQSADQELIAVLRFQASLNYFHSRLNEYAQSRDLNKFKIGSESLRQGLLEDAQLIQLAFRDLPSVGVRGAAIPSTLDAIQSSLPGYLDSIQSLASAGDWSALQDRLTNQLQPLEFLSTELVKSVDRDVAEERADATMSVHAGVTRMFVIVALTGGLYLLIAGALGIIITRSITTPLDHLMEGSRALARADFHHRIPVIGDDELAQLARDLNRTTAILLEQFALRLEERVNERTRLARELHDTLLQTIDASKVVAETALESATDFDTMLVAVRKLSNWLGQGTLEVRAALDSLRATSVSGGDLTVAIERGVADVIARTHMSVRFETRGIVTKLHRDMHEEVYRIACEAIRNACVHSGASLVIVDIQYRNGLVLRVGDNGTGIDPQIAETGKAGHFGLPGMKERAARIGGKLTVESSSGNGTLVILRIPSLAG